MKGAEKDNTGKENTEGEGAQQCAAAAGLQRATAFECDEGSQLQAARQSTSNQTSEGQEIREGGDGTFSRQDGEAWHRSGTMVHTKAAGDSVHGESSRQPVQETLHARLGGGRNSQSRGSLLCLSSSLYEADPHLDEPDRRAVATEGQHWHRAVRAQVPGGVLDSKRAMGSQVQDSSGELASQRGTRSQGEQEYDAPRPSRRTTDSCGDEGLKKQGKTTKEKADEENGELEPD